MKIFTAAQMRSAELLAVQGGISFPRLMENAGSACAKKIKDKLKSFDKNVSVTILCGKGNNGGDGFVIARKLVESGYTPCVILAAGRPTTSDASDMLRMLSGLSVKVIDRTLSREAADDEIRKSAVIIDAVFGIGFRGTPDESLSSLFKISSETNALKIAIDVPSGVESDSGKVGGECFAADMTIAVSELKPAHIIYPAKSFCGVTVTATIGVEELFYSHAEYSAYSYCSSEIKSFMPKRADISNKGDFGRVLCICGSKNYVGAAYLCAMGAVRSGAGLVFAAFPECAYPAIGSKLTETPLIPLPSNTLGTLSVGAIPYLMDEIQKCDVIVLGCGLGLNGDTAEIVQTVIENASCPIILDADGINAICGNIDILRKAKAPLILTPHPGEMSRLCGMTVHEIQQNRVNAAVSFAEQYGVTLVLKGANTIVAKPGEAHPYINMTGNSGLAKGGSGDMLSGIIAGFAAQGIPDAAAVGVYVHGLCGDFAARRLSQRGITPSDCLSELPLVLSEFE